MSREPSLEKLLEVHDSFKNVENSYNEALGDGYLQENNIICKNIRKAFLELGGKIEENPPFPYNTFPLLALEEILQKKIVPLTNNLYWLRKVSSEQPNVFKASDFNFSPVRNYMLHESAHVLAHTLLENEISTPVGTNEKLRVVKLMLGEAFANSSEALCCAFLEPKLNPLTFALVDPNLNFKNPSQKLKKYISILGLKTSMKVTILLFLYSNFLYASIDRKIDRRIWDFCGLDLAVRKNAIFLKNYDFLKKLYVFRLNPLFRVQTAEIYLKRMGFKKSLGPLLAFDPLAILEKSDELKKVIDQLSALAAG